MEATVKNELVRREGVPRAVCQEKHMGSRAVVVICRDEEVVERVATRTGMAGRFVSAYRQYCWRVVGIDDLKLAEFHLLATEGGVHVDRDHLWHMETLRRIAEADGSVVTATPYRVVDVDPASPAGRRRPEPAGEAPLREECVEA